MPQRSLCCRREVTRPIRGDGVNPMMTIIAFAKQIAREVAAGTASPSPYSPQLAN